MPKLLLKTPEEYKQELELYKQLKKDVAVIFKTPEFERQELIQALKLEKESKDAAEKLIFDQIASKEDAIRKVVDIDEFNKLNDVLERDRTIFSSANLNKYTIPELEKTKLLLNEIRRVDENKGSTSKSRYIKDSIDAINRRLAAKSRISKKTSKSAASPGAVGAPSVASPVGVEETKDDGDDDEFEDAEEDFEDVDDNIKNAIQQLKIIDTTLKANDKKKAITDLVKNRYNEDFKNLSLMGLPELKHVIETGYTNNQAKEFIQAIVDIKKNLKLENNLRKRLDKLNNDEVAAEQTKLLKEAVASATMKKRKSQTPKAALEGKGISKTNKSKPKSKSKSIGKQEQIYYILSKKAGNNNKLMKKRLKTK